MQHGHFRPPLTSLVSQLWDPGHSKKPLNPDFWPHQRDPFSFRTLDSLGSCSLRNASRFVALGVTPLHCKVVVFSFFFLTLAEEIEK